jgi:hypothetical protein
MAVFNTGCLFPEIIEVDVFDSEEEGFGFSVSTNAEISLCTQESDNEFTCLYAGEAGADISSNVILTGADILLLLFFDPLIIQLPSNATNIAGSFLHIDSGTSGNLAITSGLTSFNADSNTTITAGPGTQFVILDLPDGAPTTGDFAFNFNFQMPPRHYFSSDEAYVRRKSCCGWADILPSASSVCDRFCRYSGA